MGYGRCSPQRAAGIASRARGAQDRACQHDAVYADTDTKEIIRQWTWLARLKERRGVGSGS